MPALAVLKLCNSIFEAAHLPDHLQEAVVVPIPKKGDPADLANTRPIALTSVVLRLMSRIVAARISKGLEDGGLLCKEQAGFRSREECLRPPSAPEVGTAAQRLP